MFVQIYLLCFAFGNKTLLFLSFARFLIVMEILSTAKGLIRVISTRNLIAYAFQIIVYELIII